MWKQIFCWVLGDWAKDVLPYLKDHPTTVSFRPLSRVVPRPNGLNSLYMEQFRVVFMGQQKYGKILAMAYESNTGPVGFVLNKNVPKTTNQPYTWKQKAEQKISVQIN